MSRTRIINHLRRAVTPVLAIALALTLAALYDSKTSAPIPGQGAAPGAAVLNKDATPAGTPPLPTSATGVMATNAQRSDVTIVILNSGDKTPPLAFKLGKRLIKVPGPASWPRDKPQNGADGKDGRYRAAIIDSADVLQANGYQADAAFSLVVGGDELNPGNTFRIKGNPQPALAGDGPVVEYHTQVGEPGIWRSLQFKNLIVSHAEVPSLEAHLVRAQGTATAENPAAARTAAANGQAPATAAAANGNTAAQVASLEDATPESTRKYVEALDSPDPAVRADAIQSLLLNGYREASPGADGSAKMESLISKSLLDNNANVRASTMDALDAYDGNLPQATLSHMALNDSNPGLRIQALDLLVERFAGQAAATLQKASHDPDPRVSRLANQLLLEATNGSQP